MHRSSHIWYQPTSTAIRSVWLVTQKMYSIEHNRRIRLFEMSLVYVGRLLAELLVFVQLVVRCVQCVLKYQVFNLCFFVARNSDLGIPVVVPQCRDTILLEFCFQYSFTNTVPHTKYIAHCLHYHQLFLDHQDVPYTTTYHRLINQSTKQPS